MLPPCKLLDSTVCQILPSKKKLDAVFVNDIASGRAFGNQDNILTPVVALGPQAPLGPLPKDQLAQALVAWWGARLGSQIENRK